MKKIIMVMHKNRDTRLTIKILLEKHGYKVIEVLSTKDFHKKIKKPGIALVLINGLMPREKVLEETSKRNIKCLYFISDSIDEKEMALYKNVIGSIKQPFDIKEFHKKIDEILG